MSHRVRFPELDLLRFVAACAVMLFHYTFRGPADGAWNASFPLLDQVSRYGYLGVQVFFILSGFVILLTAYEKNAVGFGIARFVRLYPAYWICVTLTTLVIVIAGGPRHISLRQYLANLTMIHGYFGITDVSGVYWTLAVELKFYFLIFLVLVFRMVHRLSYLLGAWLCVSILLSLKAPHGIANFFLFPEWSSYFIAGSMLFLIHRQGVSAYKLALVSGCYAVSIAYAIGFLPLGAGALESGTSKPVLVGLITVFYLVFIGIALRKRSPTTADRFYAIGLLTYPLYLIHQDVGYVLLRSAPAALNPYLLLLTIIAVMISLAWLLTFGPERWLAARLKIVLRPFEKGPVHDDKSLLEPPVVIVIPEVGPISASPSFEDLRSVTPRPPLEESAAGQTSGSA